MTLRMLLNRVGAGAVVGLLALVAAPAQAAFTGLINIDFKSDLVASPNYTGPAAIGAAGDVWNSITESFSSATASNLALVASDNSATSVTLGYDIGGAYPAGGFAPTLGHMMNDYFYKHTTGGPGSVTLSGLTANAGYDVYLYATTNFDKSYKYTINGVDKFLLNDVAVLTLTQDVNFIKYAATADAAGKINILFTGGPTVTGGPDFEGLISGIQLQSIAPIVVTPPGPAVPLPPALFAGLLAPALVWPARKRFMKK